MYTNDIPTHFVSEVVYGADFHFEFRKIFQKNDSKDEIAGGLDVTINLLPGMSIGGKARLNLTEDQNKTMENTSVRYYGDFLLDNSPLSYKEAGLAIDTITDRWNKATQSLETKKSEIHTVVQYKVTDIRSVCRDGSGLADHNPFS